MLRKTSEVLQNKEATAKMPFAVANNPAGVNV
jgi:hypothetical protein